MNDLSSTSSLQSFDSTLVGVFGSDVASIVNQVIMWVFIAGLIAAIVGGLAAIVLRRVALALSHNTEKYEQVKRAEKTTIISVCIIAGISIVGTGVIWIVLGIVSGGKLDEAASSASNTSSSTSALITYVQSLIG